QLPFPMTSGHWFRPWVEHIMIPSRFAALLILVFLGTIGFSPAPVHAQKRTASVDKQAEAIRNLQKLLDEQQITTSQFQKEMPLAEFLAALEKQLPEGKKVALRIDREAFGKEAAALARTPLLFPTTKMSLRRMLEQVLGKIKTKA